MSGWSLVLRKSVKMIEGLSLVSGGFQMSQRSLIYLAVGPSAVLLNQ